MSVTLTILSNGYGEDSIGAKLAAEIVQQRPLWQVQAYPTVDAGNAYEGLVPILGQRKIMPSGGLMVHHPQLFWQDIRAGFLSMVVRQLRDLAALQTDALIVVGDVYALLLSQLVSCKKRFYIQSLVSAYHENQQSAWHRQTMENFTLLERWLLRQNVTRMYLRDAVTHDYLQEQGFSQATFLGNPMMDGVVGDVFESSLSLTKPCIALLAGSRDYAPDTLAIMLQALQRWEETENVTALLAWARPMGELESVFVGWKQEIGEKVQGHVVSYSWGGTRVHVLHNRFGAVLHAADIVWGTAGTANEQAAGMGKPVVSFTFEPFYSHKFLDNQKRLLADALTISIPKNLVRDTQNLHNDAYAYQRARTVGQQRMGNAGGTQRIVADILAHLLF